MVAIMPGISLIEEFAETVKLVSLAAAYSHRHLLSCGLYLSKLDFFSIRLKFMSTFLIRANKLATVVISIVFYLSQIMKKD